MSEKEKPTIAELEALLNEPNKKINIMPDGSIVAVGGDENAYDAYIKQQDATITALRDEVERLKDAATGRGMVSEMADMAETAVLVCGLHDRAEQAEKRLAVAEGKVEKMRAWVVKSMFCSAPYCKGCADELKQILGEP